MTINYLKKFRLKKKRAIVLGGCGLIGEQISLALSAAGEKVYIFDINKKKGEEIEKKNKGKIFFHYFDVAKIELLEKNINTFISKDRCPDIFINSTYPATDNWGSSSFKNNTLSNLRNNVDIQLNSNSWSAYKICELMKKSKIKGSVILLSSIYGVSAQNMSLYKNTSITENMNYPIIKAGIINFSKQLSSYYSQYGLRINTISPGGIRGHVKNSKSRQDKNFLKNYKNMCPMKRMGNPEEIASVALFLATDASSYISGTNILVDGGWSAI